MQVSGAHNMYHQQTKNLLGAPAEAVTRSATLDASASDADHLLTRTAPSFL
jgi:hypothetical protein